MSNELENDIAREGIEEVQEEEVLIDLSDTTDEQPIESDDELETLRKQNATLLAQKAHLKKKLDDIKPHQKEEVQSNSKDLSMSDMFALMRSNVSEEDLDYVKKFAQLENKSVADVLKQDELKQVLAIRAEKRNTALATNTRTTVRGNQKVSEDILLDRALRRGELPDSDEDLDRLVRARQARK